MFGLLSEGICVIREICVIKWQILAHQMSSGVVVCHVRAHREAMRELSSIAKVWIALSTDLGSSESFGVTVICVRQNPNPYVITVYVI